MFSSTHGLLRPHVGHIIWISSTCWRFHPYFNVFLDLYGDSIHENYKKYFFYINKYRSVKLCFLTLKMGMPYTDAECLKENINHPSLSGEVDSLEGPLEFAIK
jgi:hypothetical protein